MRGDPNRNLVAAISYLFGFITGIVILFIEKDDKYIRFHATQSVLVFGIIFAVNVIINIIFAPIDFLGVVTTLLSTLISIVAVIVWAVSMYQAFSGRIFKWPVVGEFAEKRVK